MRWVLAVMLAAACASRSSPRLGPEAPEVPETRGRAARLQLGDLEAYAVEDGHLFVPNDGQTFGFGRPPAETAEVLAAAGLPRDKILLGLECLLVRAGDRVILFDAGAGGLPVGEGDVGHLPQSLALAHVAPGAVTDIFISHAHTDHVGGLVTKAGALAFPAATIHISAPEWAALQAEPDDDSRRMVAAIAAKVSAFQPGAQVLPVVQAASTPGHTVGHSSYWIWAGRDRVFYLGDVAHHVVISVQHPAWSVQFDVDRPAAEAMRQGTLATLAADHVRVFAGHFPFPGTGQFAAAGQGFVWKPEAR